VPYRLVAIDLDGTLLNSSGRMSAANAAAVTKVVAAGVAVAPATARWYQAAVQPFAPLGVPTAAIAAAGADVRDAAGKVALQRALPADVARAIARIVDQDGWMATLATPERAYRRSDVLPPWAANAPEWLVPVTHLRDADLSQLLSVLAEVAPEDARLAAFVPWSQQLTMRSARSFNGNQLVTLTAAGVDKGVGLRALCEAMDIDLRDTVAIGDDDVDLPMFELAGLSIAMGNADPAVRAAADIVTKSADDDGVAAALLGL